MKEYKPTTNKLNKSRLIKVGLIGVFSLLLIQGVSWGFMLYILKGIQSGLYDLKIESISIILGKYLDILGAVNVVAGIGTIITAIIARYGLREMTGNLSREGESCGEN